MKVTSLIERKEGHCVTLGNEKYEFRPPEYSCAVSKREHLDVFKGIPEGYKVEQENPKSAKVETRQSAQPALKPVSNASVPG